MIRRPEPGISQKTDPVQVELQPVFGRAFHAWSFCRSWVNSSRYRRPVIASLGADRHQALLSLASSLSSTPIEPDGIDKPPKERWVVLVYTRRRDIPLRPRKFPFLWLCHPLASRSTRKSPDLCIGHMEKPRDEDSAWRAPRSGRGQPTYAVATIWEKSWKLHQPTRCETWRLPPWRWHSRSTRGRSTCCSIIVSYQAHP